MWSHWSEYTKSASPCRDPWGTAIDWVKQIIASVGSVLGVRPICQHNFGNNRMLKEPRIMLE